MSTVSAALTADSGPAKLSVATLKSHLKSVSMSQSGEKQTLWVRCKLHHQVSTNQLRTADGSDPTQLKPSALKKTCARAARKAGAMRRGGREWWVKGSLPPQLA